MKKVQLNVRIPADLAIRLDALVADSLGRVRHGAKQRAVVEALWAWVIAQEKQRNTKEGGE